MLKYAILVFVVYFLLQNLHAEDVTENLTEDPHADLVFPNYSVIALDEFNYPSFPGTQVPKMFVVVGYIKANWFRAQEICSYQGLTLASVNSQAESDMLKKYLARAGLNSQGESFWLGGTVLSGASRWIWFNTGRPVAYSNWASGQPDNAGNSEKCFELLDNGYWNDLSCDAERFFICETRCPLTSYDTLFKKK